jgi:hypothetical protein
MGMTTGSLNGPNQGSTDVWLSKYNSKGNALGKRTLQLGSSAADHAFNVVTDKDGNFYMAGDTGGSLVAGKQSSNGSDAWVAKYNRNGTMLWGRQVGGSLTGGFQTTGTGLQVDDDGNVYLSGIAIKTSQNPGFPIQDDSWVMKFDSDGEQQWFTEITENSPTFDESYDLAVDRDGNSYLVGWTQGIDRQADPSRPLLNYDAWLSKVATDGTIEWTRQFGSTDEGVDFAWGVDTDSQGNIYVLGWTTGTFPDGGENFGSYDVWLTKFTPNGTQDWKKQIGSAGDDGGLFSDILIDESDNLFVSGYTNGNLGPDDLNNSSDVHSYDAWVGRFDVDGNEQWIQTFGIEDKADYATRLAVDNIRGLLYATGFTEGSLGNVDSWVTQLDVENGKLQELALAPLGGTV